MLNSSTICALSTAAGKGAIAVVRITGPNAFAIVQKVTTKQLNTVQSHSSVFARIKKADGAVLDETVISIFEEGRSFTGEQTVEIACHGSHYIQQELLQLLLQNGCEMAQPGEFTMRAFLNGRMDLSQAEAVGDLIAAESTKAHEVAMNQMRGSFSNELKILREKLIHFASLVELELDFAEEDVEFADRSELAILIDEVINYIKRLIASFELGNVLKNGVPVALIGAPNTGKSTLLNQLIGEERAIVSTIAGTTRDVIEEQLNINGIAFRLIDTAGIREGAEEIEALGIEKSFEKIKQAKVVLIVSDFSNEASKQFGHLSMNTTEAQSWAEELKKQFPNKLFLVLGNKSDLRTESTQKQESSAIPFLSISAQKGEGIDELKKWLVDQITGDFEIGQETIVSNIRHLEALQKALISLTNAQNGLVTQVTGDFIAMDIRQAMHELGSITGQISTDDLLGNIFSKFCIGK